MLKSIYCQIYIHATCFFPDREIQFLFLMFSGTGIFRILSKTRDGMQSGTEKNKKFSINQHFMI